MRALAGKYPGPKAGKKKNPASDLQQGQSDRQISAHAGPVNNARRPKPGIHRQHNRQGRSYNRDWEHKDRNRRQRKGGGIVECPLGLQLSQLALLPPRFKASRAEMLIIEFHITKSAQESPATAARNDGALLWMIKATGFPLHHDVLAKLGLSRASKQGRKYVRIKGSVTTRAFGHLRLVEKQFRQRSVAFGTGERRTVHGRRLFPDHARVGDMVVQCPFLAVKSSDDVADVADQSA